MARAGLLVFRIPLKVGGIEEARRHLWAIRQSLLEAISVAEPHLPFFLVCLDT
jgi:hypothetical protein